MQDHYGLEKVKERILEYLAVQQRVSQAQRAYSMFSRVLQVSVKRHWVNRLLKATGRKYVRMALGGVRDEAEIRGHRRTYIGSLPGKLIQKMCKSGVKNPLFLLDEIDKMSSDMRGDPAVSLIRSIRP